MIAQRRIRLHLQHRNLTIRLKDPLPRIYAAANRASWRRLRAANRSRAALKADACQDQSPQASNRMPSTNTPPPTRIPPSHGRSPNSEPTSCDSPNNNKPAAATMMASNNTTAVKPAIAQIVARRKRSFNRSNSAAMRCAIYSRASAKRSTASARASGPRGGSCRDLSKVGLWRRIGFSVRRCRAVAGHRKSFRMIIVPTMP